MTPKRAEADPGYAMVYASRMGGPRMYIGPCVLNPGESDADIIARIGALPVAEWFDDMSVIVHNRPK